MLFFSCGAGAAAAAAVHQTNQTNVYWPNRNSNGSSPGRRMQFHMLRNTYVRRCDYTSALSMRICALLPMTSWKKTIDAFCCTTFVGEKKNASVVFFHYGRRRRCGYCYTITWSQAKLAQTTACMQWAKRSIFKRTEKPTSWAVLPPLFSSFCFTFWNSGNGANNNGNAIMVFLRHNAKCEQLEEFVISLGFEIPNFSAAISAGRV